MTDERPPQRGHVARLYRRGEGLVIEGEAVPDGLVDAVGDLLDTLGGIVGQWPRLRPEVAVMLVAAPDGAGPEVGGGRRLQSLRLTPAGHLVPVLEITWPGPQANLREIPPGGDLAAFDVLVRAARVVVYEVTPGRRKHSGPVAAMARDELVAAARDAVARIRARRHHVTRTGVALELTEDGCTERTLRRQMHRHGVTWGEIVGPRPDINAAE